MNVCMYTHTHTHTHVNAYIHTYVHTYDYVYTHTHTKTFFSSTEPRAQVTHAALCNDSALLSRNQTRDQRSPLVVVLRRLPSGGRGGGARAVRLLFQSQGRFCPLSPLLRGLDAGEQHLELLLQRLGRFCSLVARAAPRGGGGGSSGGGGGGGGRG